MADKLEIYNEALTTHLNTSPIATLTDSRAERRALDAVWSRSVLYVLERGMWNFASRAVQLIVSDDAVSQFAWQHAYEKPDDYVRLVKIADNEWMEPTLANFSEEGSFIFADVDPVYAIYVSKDPAYGLDLGKWSEAFGSAVSAEMAFRGGGSIKPLSTDDKSLLFKLKKRLLNEAKSFDASNQPISELPRGRLTRARAGRSGVYNRMRRTPYA